MQAALGIPLGEGRFGALCPCRKWKAIAQTSHTQTAQRGLGGKCDLAPVFPAQQGWIEGRKTHIPGMRQGIPAQAHETGRTALTQRGKRRIARRLRNGSDGSTKRPKRKEASNHTLKLGLRTQILGILDLLRGHGQRNDLGHFGDIVNF